MRRSSKIAGRINRQTLQENFEKRLRTQDRLTKDSDLYYFPRLIRVLASNAKIPYKSEVIDSIKIYINEGRETVLFSEVHQLEIREDQSVYVYTINNREKGLRVYTLTFEDQYRPMAVEELSKAQLRHDKEMQQILKELSLLPDYPITRKLTNAVREIENKYIDELRSKKSRPYWLQNKFFNEGYDVLFDEVTEQLIDETLNIEEHIRVSLRECNS